MRIVFLFATLVALSVLQPDAYAETYPSRPITLVSPFAAGGSTDVVARLVAQQISKQLGQPVVLQNVPGAGGSLAAAKAAGADPDGYTLFFGTLGTHVFNVGIYKSLSYDPIADFTPITLVASYPLVLIVNQTSPYRNAADLVKAARERPGALSFGSGGIGSTAHVSCQLFGDVADIKTQHVPYRSTNPATIDLIGDIIHYLCDLAPAAVPNIYGGKTKALAVMAEKRSRLLPNVPTLAESGYPGFNAYTWNALFAPSGTPAEIVQKIQHAAIAGLQDPEVVATIDKLGVDLPSSDEVGPTYLSGLIQAETKKWVPLLRKSGASGE